MRLLDRVHHVGIACRDLESVRRWLHATREVTSDSGVVHDPLQQADVCLLEMSHGPAIELVAGAMVSGMVKRGQTYYHMCFEVDSIPQVVDQLSGPDCRLVSAPQPAVLFGGRAVAFMLGPTGLIELLEAHN